MEPIISGLREANERPRGARFIFSGDGALIERQVLRTAKNEILYRLLCPADGTVKLLDAKGKELAVRPGTLAAGKAPELAPDTKGLVVLPLPYRSREHCYLVLDRHCEKIGCTPGKFFAKVVKHGNVEDALDDVVRGEVDAAQANVGPGSKYEGFLLVITYWIGAWLGVVLTDYWMRRGNFGDEAIFYERAYANWAGPIAMFVGGAIAIWLFADQSVYVGYVAFHYPQIGDMTFVIDFILSAAIYYLLRMSVFKPVARESISTTV